MSPSLRRPVAVAVTAVTALTMLTGCVRADADATVSSENTVSGTFSFGLNEAVIASMGMSASDMLESEVDPTDELGDAEWAKSIETSEWKEDGFVGVQAKFVDVPLDAFNSELLPALDLYSQDGSTTSVETDFSFSSENGEEPTPASETTATKEPQSQGPDPRYPAPQITRVEDEFRVTGVLDFSKERAAEMSEGNESLDLGMSGEESEGLAAGGGVELSLTFPGKVRSQTGTVEGSTVTWDVPLGKRLEVTATASGSEEVVSDAGKSTKNWGGLAAMIAGLLMLVGAGVGGLLFVRGRRASDGDGAGTTGAGTDLPAELSSRDEDSSLEQPADDYDVDLDAPVAEFEPVVQPAIEDRGPVPVAEQALETFEGRGHPVAERSTEDGAASGRRRADVPVDSAPQAVAQAPSRVEPGWYPTADGAHLRWHDGIQWTEHTHPVQ